MTGTHKHKCNSCGHLWEHSDRCAGNQDAHTCEKCGAEQWGRYYGEPRGSTEAEEIHAAFIALLRGPFFGY